MAGAKRAKMPASQAPQLAQPADDAPKAGDWLSEIKLDGYRLLAFKQGGTVRLMTRNGLDWTHRLGTIAAAVAKAGPDAMLLDGELAALRQDGTSSFADLQAALSGARGIRLTFHVFDLLHWNGWDFRAARLDARKQALAAMPIWSDTIRYSDHTDGDPAKVRKHACAMKLEGIIAKRADAPYRAGRGESWVKLKCQGREEFVILGWTPPSGRRSGIGALHLGFYDSAGALHYVGGVGTGFTEPVLKALRTRLDALALSGPTPMRLSGERPDATITWVRPDLVAEVNFAGWSGAGRVRHAVYLGLREDKAAAEVVRDLPDPDAARLTWPAASRTTVVTAKPPGKHPPAAKMVRTKPMAIANGAVHLSHPDKELWPGITKQALADYWAAVAETALPGIAGRPLALVRCPDGIDGQSFFQKHAMKGQPPQIREGEQDGAPYLYLDDADGLQAAAQLAAIELHSWGSATADAAHADRLVFDLDPGPGVDWADTVKAAIDVRDRLERAGLAAFCRTSGGKGAAHRRPHHPRPGLGQCARLVPQLCRGDGGPGARPLRVHRAQGAPQWAHPGRLVAQWAGFHRRRLLLPARPPGRHRRHPHHLARRHGTVGPCGPYDPDHPQTPGPAEGRPLGWICRCGEAVADAG